MVILNGLFAWLVDAGYLAGNPLSLARSRRGQPKPRITRYLSHDMWQAVKDTIEAMPGATDTATERERLHAARCRWLLTVLYLGGLRAAEVASTRMGAFFYRRDRNGVERWWMEVTGKGNKTWLVPATDELIAELARYRRAHGLPPTPQIAVPLDTAMMTKLACHTGVSRNSAAVQKRLRQKNRHRLMG